MSLNIKKDFRKDRKPDLTTLIYGKIPPQAIEMEEAVIGSCLLERDTFRHVIEILQSGEPFYIDANQKIYQVMVDMFAKGHAIDLLTVAEELKRRSELDMVGGNYYLSNLTMSVLSSANVKEHAFVVLEMFYKRELIRIGAKLMSDGYDDCTDVFEMIDGAKNELECVTKDIQVGGDATIGQVFDSVVDELEIQKDKKCELTGIDTGLNALNELTNGWQKSDLIILAARPSKGKTALSLNLSYAAAISSLVEKVPVGFFSLEMPNKQLVKRMVSTVTGIDFKKIISGNLTDDEFKMVKSKRIHFNTLPIHISDKIFSLANICAKARKWKEKFNIGLLLIDYLQLIKAIRKQGGNREQEIAGITSDLKILAKELEIPIILLSQLNRNVESRASPEPVMADLRESGAIEQDADIILFPWHSADGSFITVAKHRNGQTAVGENALPIKFAGSIQKWMEPEAFEPFKETYVSENARAGIQNNYQKVKADVPDEDAPF